VTQVQIRPGESAQPGEQPYQPRGGALELWRSKRREVLLAGPAGTGKSRAALEKINLVAMQKPIRAAIVRKTRAAITQSAMVTFETKVLTRPSAVKWHETDQEYRYPNGARVVVGGLDNPDKIGSTEFDLVYVQEATELESDDWGMLLRGLRNNKLSYQQLLADCNPSYPQHWLKLRCDEGVCQLIDSQHEDNPMLWDGSEWTEFGRNYIAGLDALKGYQHSRLRLGLWVAAEGMYFTEWNPRVHIVESRDIPPEWPRWVSVDYGFAVPFCALWFARDPESRIVYVYREVYESGIRDEQQARMILDRSKDERIFFHVLDPSMFNPRTEAMRPSIARVYWDEGLGNLYGAMNNRKQGWAVVRRALATDQDQPPHLAIIKSAAPNLIRELPALVRDPLDPEDVADVVGGRKIDDHAADALRYGLVAEAQPPSPGRSKLSFG
jgi:PBSX family phage terminase large subunit